MKIGNRIRELRYQKRIKQMELAKKIGVTKLTLGCYERGTTKITLEAINKIAEAFEMNTLEFLRPVYQTEYTEVINDNCRVKDRVEDDYISNKNSIQCNVKSILKHLDLEKLYNDDEDIKNLEHNIINIIKFESYKKINNL